MKVYELISSWMYHGDSCINEVYGVFSSMIKARNKISEYVKDSIFNNGFNYLEIHDSDGTIYPFSTDGLKITEEMFAEAVYVRASREQDDLEHYEDWSIDCRELE